MNRSGFALCCTLLLTSLMLIPFARASTLRCGPGLVAEGDPMARVGAICGPPLASASEGPAMRPDGTPRFNSARITVWVYGPDGGAYRYLRFVDERLVEIDLRRRAPDGPLLPW